MSIKKFIKNWLFSTNSGDNLIKSIVEEPENNKSMQFKIWFAQGGKVIQTRRYDSHKDKIYTNMYVIHEEQNIGQELENIILKESLYS